jgi:hypothetical protein
MQIHVSRDGQTYGPYSPTEFQELVHTGHISPRDHVWLQSTEWQPLVSLRQMFFGSEATLSEAPQFASPQPAMGLAAAGTAVLAGAALYDGYQHHQVAQELHQLSAQVDQSQQQLEHALAEIDPVHHAAGLAANELGDVVPDTDHDGLLDDLLSSLFS